MSEKVVLTPRSDDPAADQMRSLESGDVKSETPNYRTGIIAKVCIFILLTEMCERLAYYGLSGSMKTFLINELGYTQELASSMTTVLPAIVYVTPLLGGFLADTYWGRYKTILVFSILYIIGCGLMATSAYPSIDSSWMFLTGLIGFVGLGSGGIKSNVITLGGDQFDVTKPEEAKQQETFFNYFYWSINIGALVAYGYLQQLALNGSGHIPAAYGFCAVFTICGSCLTLAVLLFVCFSSRYIKVPPSGSAVANFISSFNQIAKTSCRGSLVRTGVICQVLGWLLATCSAFMARGEGLSVAFLASIIGMALCMFGLIVVIIFCADPSWALPESTQTLRSQDSIASEKKTSKPRRQVSSSMKRAYSVSHSVDTSTIDLAIDADDSGFSAEKTYDFLRILPILMFSVIFWIIYDQMAANFYSQSCQMNVFFNGRSGSQLNAAVLNVADCIAVIICIPIFDTCLYPMISRIKGSPYTPLQKIGTGFVTAFLSMIVAIVIEYKRRASPVRKTKNKNNSHHLLSTPDGELARSMCASRLSDAADSPHQAMSNISVYWMLIPYFLIGVSECLISGTVPLYDMCYTEVPEELRSTTQAVNLFMTAIAGAVAGAISKALASFMHNDLNTSHIEYQYYVAASLALIALPSFMIATRNFKYHSDTQKAEEELATMETPADQKNASV